MSAQLRIRASSRLILSRPPLFLILLYHIIGKKSIAFHRYMRCFCRYRKFYSKCRYSVLCTKQCRIILHKGKVTVKIDALAASAASVVAMSGDETFISPTGMLMVHDPACMASGNKADMVKAIEILDEIKEYSQSECSLIHASKWRPL